METYEAIRQANSASDKLKAEESFNKQVNTMDRVSQMELIPGTMFNCFNVKSSNKV